MLIIRTTRLLQLRLLLLPPLLILLLLQLLLLLLLPLEATAIDIQAGISEKLILRALTVTVKLFRQPPIDKPQSRS